MEPNDKKEDLLPMEHRLEFLSGLQTLPQTPKDLKSIRSIRKLSTSSQKTISKVVLFESVDKFAVASHDGTITIWSLTRLKPLRTLKIHNSNVTNIIKLHDGRLASASYDNTVKITNIYTGIPELTLPHSKIVFALMQLPNGIVISGGLDSCVKFWDVKQTENHNSCIKKIEQAGQKDCCAMTILGENHIACGSHESINIYDISDYQTKPVKVIEGHSALVRDLIALKDGKTLVSSAYDGIIMISDWRSGVVMKTLMEFNHVTNISRFAEGLFVICDLGDKNKDASIYLCDLVNPPLVRLGQHKVWVSSISYCANGIFMSYGSDYFIRFWF